jgi:hypothetical protein
MPFRAFRRRLLPLLAVATFALPVSAWGSALASAPCPATPAPAVEETESGIMDEGLHPAGDLDADGRPDAIHVGETSLAAVKGHDGSTLWSSAGAVDAVYRAGDLDDVPGADLIVWSNNTTHVGTSQVREYVVRGFSGSSGATLWTRTFPSLVNFGGPRHEGAVSVLSPPADLDGDGARDLLLGQYFQEADTMFTRGLFESMSGKTGLPIARYGAGVGSWYHPLNGPTRQLPFAVVVPDLTGDCLADVAVNASRLSVSAIQAFPGTGGAPIWHLELQHEGNERVLEVTPAHLNGDASGDVLLSIGIFGNAPSSGSEVKLVALSGVDGAQIWSSMFPQNLSRVTLQPAADGSGDDILLSGPFARSFGTIGLVDGSTGAIRWQRSYQDGWPFLAGDATGDGRGDIVIRLERCVMGCVDTEAQLISSSDGSVVWTREALQGESLIAAEGDLDGDGLNDLFAFRDGEGSQPSFYTAVSGKDGDALWPAYRRMDEVVSILRVAPLDIRPNPGVDVLEGFRADDHAAGPAARPGTGGAPIWFR